MKVTCGYGLVNQVKCTEVMYVPALGVFLYSLVHVTDFIRLLFVKEIWLKQLWHLSIITENLVPQTC